MSQATSKHANTKWKEYHSIEMTVRQKENGGKEWLLCICPNGFTMTYNYSLLAIQLLKPKCFIIDKDDLKWWLAQRKGEKSEDCLGSCSEFLKERPEKRIYIRKFPTVGGGTDISRILTDEILEMIPLVLKQQNTPLNDSDDRLEGYRKKWSTCQGILLDMWYENDESMHNTIDMEEFKQVLEDFDVNKELITVVPDIDYKFSTQMHTLEDIKHATAQSPNGEEMMYPSTAIFFIFQCLVHGARWNKNYCQEHSNCKKDLKGKLLNVMNKYATMDQTIFVSFAHVHTEVGCLVDHCTNQHHMKDLVGLNVFDQYIGSEFIPMSCYKMLCRELDITTCMNLLRNKHKQEETIIAWMARMYITIGQFQRFVPSNMVQLKSAFKVSLTTRVPPEFSNDMKDVMDEIFSANDNNNSDEDDFPDSESTKNRTDKLREEAERRKQKLQKKKDAKKNKGGNNGGSAAKESVGKSKASELDSRTKAVKKIVKPKSDDVATSSQIMAREMTKKLLKGTENLSREELVKKLEGVEVSLHFEKPENVDDSKVAVMSSSELMEKLEKVKSLSRGIESRITKLEEIKVKDGEAQNRMTECLNSAKSLRNQMEKPEFKVDPTTKDTMKKVKSMHSSHASPRGSSSETKKQNESKNTSPDMKKEEEKRSDSKTRKEEPVTKCCSKCLRTSQMCNEAKKELKTAQNKLMTFEDKAKKIDEMEKKVKEMRKKMTEKDQEMEKKMKEKNKEIDSLKNTNSESQKELKTTQNKLKTSENRAVDMEKKVKERDEEIQQLKMTNSESDKELKKKDQMIEELKRNLEAETQSKRLGQNTQTAQLEMELLEKNRIIARLEENNMRVTVRNEEQARNIQNLLDRLSGSSSK